MSILDARFAKLNFEYDRDRAFKEAESLMPLLEWTRSAPGYLGVDIPFSVDPVGHHDSFDPMKTSHTWKSTGLTHVIDTPISKHGRGSFRNRSVNREWVWRDDLPDISYLKELCLALPFDTIGCIRVIALPAGNVGSVHHDDPSSVFYATGHRSATLNLNGGGSLLEFMHNGKHYTVNDYPAFIFRDDCWHGVPKVEALRFQVRINGLFKPEMEQLIDKEICLL